jgi:hypothetical protein
MLPPLVKTYEVDAKGIRAMLWLNVCRYCVFQTLDFNNHLVLFGALEVIKDFSLQKHISSNSIYAWEFGEIIDLCLDTQKAITERLQNGDWAKYKW